MLFQLSRILSPESLLQMTVRQHLKRSRPRLRQKLPPPYLEGEEGLNKLLSKLDYPPYGIHKYRFGWPNWHTIKDDKRRQMAFHYHPLRERLTALFRSDAVPFEVAEQAFEDLNKLPRDSCVSRAKDRCTVTGRVRGRVCSHRVSRIQWRLLADYGKLCGVTRAAW